MDLTSMRYFVELANELLLQDFYLSPPTIAEIIALSFQRILISYYASLFIRRFIFL